MSEYILDIDKTLINPKIILEEFSKGVLLKTGIETSKTMGVYENYVSTLPSRTDFEPIHFLKKLGNEIKTEEKRLNDIFFDRRNFKKALYPEVIDTLQKLKENGALMGIYSEGIFNYQMTKLELSGIDHFFKGTIIIERRKLNRRSIDRIPIGSTIFDDKEEVMETLKETDRFELVWVNRNNDQKIPDIETVKSLNEYFGVRKAS